MSALKQQYICKDQPPRNVQNYHKQTKITMARNNAELLYADLKKYIAKCCQTIIRRLKTTMARNNAKLLNWRYAKLSYTDFEHIEPNAMLNGYICPIMLIMASKMFISDFTHSAWPMLISLYPILRGMYHFHLQ